MQSLPLPTSLEELLPILKIWQQAINPVVAAPLPPRSPFNFHAIGGAAGATGITLRWEPVAKADGYEIQSTTNGDFSTAITIATLSSSVATGFFDSTIVTGVKRYYRIRSTSGTLAMPQSVKGIWTAPIIAASGSGVTVYDQMSYKTGPGGWNNNITPGFGSRTTRFY